MNTTTINPEDLMNREQAREIVKNFQRIEEHPYHMIDRVLRKVGLSEEKIEHGKVTLCVVIPHKSIRIHIRTPRISTFDRIRSEAIPYKDQTVNLANNTIFEVAEKIPDLKMSQISQKFFGLSLQSPVTVHYNCKPILFEHVLREYIAQTKTETSLYHQYFKQGKRYICGHIFPDGLLPNQKLDQIYATPSTKQGRDVSLSIGELYAMKILSAKDYEKILPESLKIFKTVSAFLEKKNLVLVDTKMEFGKNEKGEIFIMDELPTFESGRLWYKNPDGSIMKSDGKPIAFSKEFARQYGSDVLHFTKDQEDEIAIRYIIATQLITGKLFEPILKNPEEILYEDLSVVLREIKNLP